MLFCNRWGVKNATEATGVENSEICGSKLAHGSRFELPQSLHPKDGNIIKVKSLLWRNELQSHGKHLNFAYCGMPALDYNAYGFCNNSKNILVVFCCDVLPVCLTLGFNDRPPRASTIVPALSGVATEPSYWPQSLLSVNNTYLTRA